MKTQQRETTKNLKEFLLGENIGQQSSKMY